MTVLSTAAGPESEALSGPVVTDGWATVGATATASSTATTAASPVQRLIDATSLTREDVELLLQALYVGVTAGATLVALVLSGWA